MGTGFGVPLAPAVSNRLRRARLQAGLSLDYAAGLGYALEPGTTAFAVLVSGDWQSRGMAATSGGRTSDTAPSPTLYGTTCPFPGKMKCFNNGPLPLDASPGGATALATALDPADIATVVDADCTLNPLIQRDVPLFYAMWERAAALQETNHVVFGFAFGIGSTSFNDRLYGFKGSRASGTVTISGTTATITVSSGDVAAAPNLILIGAGIAANTSIVSIDSGVSTGACTATVSVSQTVGPVAFTTQDQRQQQYKNYIVALDAFAAWARANGYTPIMPDFYFIGGEAENSAVAKANGVNTLKNLRTTADEFTTRLYAGTVNAGKTAWIIDATCNSPRYDINHDPATNEGNDTPSLANMGLVNNMTLAAEAMARETDAAGVANDAKYIAIPTYHYPADADGRVHLGNDSVGYRHMGADLGLTSIYVGNGLDARWPAILQVVRVKGSTSVAVTYSEPCEFDTTQVNNPGQYGFKYTSNGSEIAINGFSWNGATLTLTLASEPGAGETEVLSYACDNATLFDGAISRQSPFGPVADGLAAGGYPWDVPVYGLARLAGQRGNVRSVATYGRDVQFGQSRPRWAVQQKISVNVTAGTGNVLTLHQTAGITPSFLIDAGDTSSVASGNQTITDLSASAALYWLGIDGTSTNDPALQAAAGSIPAWLKFDNGGAAGAESDQVLTPQGTPAFMANLHKTGGEGVLFAAVYMPAAPNYATIQYILANCRNDTSGQAGVAFRISTAGQPGFNVRGAAGVSVLSHNMPTAEKVVQGWNVFAIGIKEGATGWSLGSNGSKFVATINTYACTYTTPSAAAAEGTPRIGMNVRTTVAAADTLVNGAGLGAVGMAPWMSAETFLPVFRSLCARFGLTIGSLPQG